MDFCTQCGGKNTPGSSVCAFCGVARPQQQANNGPNNSFGQGNNNNSFGQPNNGQPNNNVGGGFGSTNNLGQPMNNPNNNQPPNQFGQPPNQTPRKANIPGIVSLILSGIALVMACCAPLIVDMVLAWAFGIPAIILGILALRKPSKALGGVAIAIAIVAILIGTGWGIIGLTGLLDLPF